MAANLARQLGAELQYPEGAACEGEGGPQRLLSAPPSPVKEQHASLCRRINGHINYFGVNGNLANVARLVRAAERIWYRWLRRRSQRTRLNWQRFGDILKAFPLPRPSIRVQLWAKLT